MSVSTMVGSRWKVLALVCYAVVLFALTYKSIIFTGYCCHCHCYCCFEFAVERTSETSRAVLTYFSSPPAVETRISDASAGVDH